MECAQLIKGGAFQHVRSLDLGVDNKSVILEDYWEGYILILGAFARYGALNRLWLSEVPFIFLNQSKKGNFRDTIAALGSTVTELGLYGCHFSSYEEMVSLIRSFPVCNFLFIRDCVTGEQAAGGNAFDGLPENRLTIKDLQLSASSSNDLLIDISNLIEDAALDIGPLTSLVCDVGTSERTQRIAAAVSSSPIEMLQLACTQPEGFQGECRPWNNDGCSNVESKAFTNHLSKWALTSLTIGPQLHGANTQFWAEAFKDLPPLPCVDNVTIIYHYLKPKAFNTDCWEYFDRVLTRTDLFPALRSVHIRSTCGSCQLIRRRWWSIYNALRTVRRKGLGPCESPAFEPFQRPDFPCVTDKC